MRLPAYPAFRELLREDKAVFDEALRRNPPSISEFTFTNLYCWREAYRFEASSLEGRVIVRTGGKYLDPIASADKRLAIERVLADTGGEFMRVPESTKALFEGDARFRVVEDPDNADYVYAARDLVSLTGRKYDGKRNLIRRFKAAVTYEYAAFDTESIRECLAFEESWCLIKGCDRDRGLGNERQAIRQMIENFSGFGLFGGSIRVEGKIVAMAIAEPLNAQTLVMHALKADLSVPGLYQTMFNDFLIRHGGDFDFVNLEQDLGVAGLRKAKLSYHPVGLVKKYSISLR